MNKEIKKEIVLCEICGYPVLHNEFGIYQDCPKCGWRRGGDNEVLEKQWGISYPMLVSLSHAREQYRNGLSFKADFKEFVRGLDFYGEVLFDYRGSAYEVCKKGDREKDSIVFSGEKIRQEFSSIEQFQEEANIRGTLLKELWDEVQDPRYM